MHLPCGRCCTRVPGSNGAGKTTTVSHSGHLAAAGRQGHATVAGLDVVTEAARVRRVIGLAGQFAAVDPNLTGRENLRLIGRLSRVGRKQARVRADELLDSFGLNGAADRLVRGYSGGMRRRLDVAAALLHRPAVLFLDEPTTGLDPESRFALWDSVRDLARSGTTVLLTTQYLEEADALADQVMIISAGRVAETGTPAELKARFGTVVFHLDFGRQEAAEAAHTALASAGYRSATVRASRSGPPPVPASSPACCGSWAAVRLTRCLSRYANPPWTTYSSLLPVEAKQHEHNRNSPAPSPRPVASPRPPAHSAARSRTPRMSRGATC